VKNIELIFFVLGIISTIKSDEFVIYLFILNEVLQIIHILSNHLQSKSATLGNSKSLITGVITTLQENRDSEQHYNKLWNEMVEFSTKHKISLEIPLQCKKKYKNTELIYNYLFIWLKLYQRKDYEKSHLNSKILFVCQQLVLVMIILQIL